MTEQEIITYLKQNQYNGVLFAFMPDDVKSWCEFNNTDLMIYDGSWLAAGDVAWFDKSHAYCLPEDYEPKPKFTSHWEEFDIDKNGYFYYEGKQYYYRDDGTFERRYSDIFRGFGGWLYPKEGVNYQLWSMRLQLIDDNGDYCTSAGTYDKVKPAIPVKIRFWRYAE